MRYYIYLDKELLQMLFCTLENTNFDIEVVEYSVRKNYGTSNEVSIDPGIESISDCESSMDKDNEKKEHRRNKSGNLCKEHIGVSYEHNNSYNVQTEKRYINIEDISNMKNNAFYHKLIKMMNSEVEKEDSRVILETGIILSYHNESIESPKDGFFILNDNYVWFDKTKLNGDIDLLCNMNCKMNVIGYMMNCEKQENCKNILKAIAIFIE
ncbi:MAG: hypothetical protein Q4D02_03525 [Clostridia bacterium]|nr:hypothetical protein [Clostridia bacterium]